VEPIEIGQCAVAFLVIVPIARALYLLVNLKRKVLKDNKKK